MPTLLLVRHGRSSANTSGILAGRTPGVTLDDTGRQQVQALAERLAPVPVVAVVSSPLERCVATAEALRAVDGPRGRHRHRPAVVVEDRLSECDYGEWTGRSLRDLAKEPHWAVVQQHPSAAVFPGGESLRDVQARALDAVRETDARVRAEHGDAAVWVAVSHGDVIKAVLADALGMHLDAFQRVVVDPASLSVVRYTATRPFVLRSNDTGAPTDGLVPPRRRRGRRAAASSDAVVGGGAGSGAGADPAAPGRSG
ncbi:MSMEG_4193 family putative phosphomutase [Aquipuribacter nitratireducens]|uniref:MSMEG_4193 family putative phosphomutase n=1 Tax=Aquipuribacter nitratireducens TaxID=650104 RepID=A0ABW0GKM7_9MICO